MKIKQIAIDEALELHKRGLMVGVLQPVVPEPKNLDDYEFLTLKKILDGCEFFRIVLEEEKRETESKAVEEFLSYYDESILEYRYACDKVVEEDKRLQDFLHEMEFAKDRNERNRIATSLQQSRRTRRINKDMAKMNEKLVKFFEDQKNRDTLNRLRQLLGQQRKEEEYLLGERTYKPRAGMR